MKPFYLLTATLLFLTSGCRVGETLPQARSLSGRDIQQQQATIADSAKHTDERPQLKEAKPATAPPPIVRLTAYQAESNDFGTPELETLPTPPVVFEAPSELRIADLESMALQNNPALAEASARVRAARGNWEQVGLPPNPVVGYSGQQLGSGGQAEQQGVYLGQEIVTGKKLQLNREVAAWEIEKAERDLGAFRLRVLTDVRIGFYEVLIAQRRRELASELVRISTQAEEAATALFKGEEVSEADPLRARVEADTARILLQTSINRHIEAWRRLTAVLGVPDLALQRLEGELETGNLNLSWQSTLRQLLLESPEIAAATADAEAARWAIERAYAQIVPNVDVQAVLQSDNGTNSSNANLQVTLPIPLWNRNQGGIRQAQAEATVAARAIDRLALDLKVRLSDSFQRFESARNQVEKYAGKGGILENSRRTLDLIRKGYQADEFGLLDLLSAQRTYFQTNLAYLDSQRELWIAYTEIRGQLLRGSLSK